MVTKTLARARSRTGLCVSIVAVTVAVAALASTGRTAGPAGAVAATVSAGSPATATPAGPASTAKLFFVKGDQFAPRVRTLAAGKPTSAAAMESLLAGPTAAERRSGIETTIPAGTRLTSLRVQGETATVSLSHARVASTAFDVSLRPARAAQIVYTLTAIPGIEHVVIKVNGIDRAKFLGTRLALKGPLDQHDLTKPITLPAKPSRVPRGAAPADPRGVQKRLAALRYLPATAVTGKWDYRTSQAVTAFQAWNRLDRDGIVGAQTLAALETARLPTPSSSRPGRRVEVYRDRGVTLLLDGAKVVRAIHSSSGTSGYGTPAGHYTVFRKERNSWSVPYQVWLPYASYFNGGIAFHAYPSVPPHPASHGCIRLPTPEARFAYDFMPIGTRVSVY